MRAYSSTEQKPAETDEKKLPSSVEECHKQIEALSSEVATLKEQVKDYEVGYIVFIPG